MGDISGDFGDEDERVHDWEHGLPNSDELFSLTQGLVPPDLLSAFNIRPEPYRTSAEVSRASHDTLSSIHGSSNFKPYNNNIEEEDEEIEEDEEDEIGLDDVVSESKKARREGEGEENKAVKRARLVWTPQLHKRFVDVVAHLGIKNAVPKTIMQMMNVEGLTRENVASHLQKYRLYLKRMQGVSFDPPANSSTTVNSTENNPPPAQEMQMNTYGHGQQGHHPQMMPVPMPMQMPMHMPVMGMGNHHHHVNNNPVNHHYHHNYYHHYQYNGGGVMQPGNSKDGSVMNNYHPPHVAPRDK